MEMLHKKRFFHHAIFFTDYHCLNLHLIVNKFPFKNQFSGAPVAQAAKHPNPGFGSGDDLMDREIALSL